MRILYVGEMGDAIYNLIAFSKIAEDIVVLNTSLLDFYNEPPGVRSATGRRYSVFNLYEGGNSHTLRLPVLLKKILRYLYGLSGFSLAVLLGRFPFESARIRNILSDQKFDVVFAAWGIGVIPDIRYVRQVYPDIPIIHNVPTFPTSQTSWLRELIEMTIFKRILPKVQGYVVGSEAMKAFMVEHFFIANDLMFVGPIYYASQYFAGRRLPLLSNKDNQRHLVFPGTNDFSKSYNDVSSQIRAVAQQGVNVHTGKVDTSAMNHPNIHFYERFDTPDLVNGRYAEYMTQFDGCLVLYNGNRKRLKLRHSIPQRFLAAFTAGIPIFMRKGSFLSCELIIIENGIGIVYESEEELRNCLLDTRKMGEMREKALELSTLYSFERQQQRFEEFLRVIINR